MPKCAFLTFLRVKNIQVPEGGPEGPVQAARRPRGGLSERSHTNAVIYFFVPISIYLYDMYFAACLISGASAVGKFKSFFFIVRSPWP